jgi:hypothetical protein
MKFNNTIMALAVVGCGLAASVSNAFAVTYTFVGAWSPYTSDAPYWGGDGPTGPLAFTGQEAAAWIFGGSASDYVISTISRDVADINHSAWYDVIGIGGGVFAEDYNNKYLGQFYGPASIPFCCGSTYPNLNAASAYIRDNFVAGTNYAFQVSNVSAVPVPAALPLLLTAIGGMFGARRLRKRKVV